MILHREQYFDAILSAIEQNWLADFETLAKDVSQFDTKTRKALEVILTAGNTSFEAMRLSSSEADMSLAYLFHFRFVEEIKDLFIFWRDLLFQRLKGHILQQDSKLTQEQLDRHLLRQKEALGEVVAELKAWLESELKALNRPQMQKQIARWKLQHIPWPIYREQLETVVNQGAAMLNNAQEATAYTIIIQQINALVRDTLTLCQQQVEALNRQAGAILAEIEKELLATPGKLAGRLKKEEEDLTPTDYKSDFSQQLELLTTALPKKWEVIIGTDHGLLLRPEIDLRSRTLQWLEGEIMTNLYEVFEMAGKALSTTRLAYSNVRNRALLIPSGAVDKIELTGFYQPLLRSRERLDLLQEKIAERSEEIVQRQTSDLQLSAIYDLSQPFLPITMQSTIRQLGQGRNRFVAQVTRLARSNFASLKRIISKVEQEESLSMAEKIARYIERRKPHPENEQYNPIFLAKGFLGTSFATGRSQEKDHFEDVFIQWEKGYRGAVLLTGRSFCGKTFFGEWMAHLYFSPTLVIPLNVNQETRYQGRKLPPTHDLSEVLDFIKKHTLHEKPLIWIDDLELWQDANFTLYENVLALRKFVDRHASRCFLMTSTNSWSYRHLQSLLNMDEAFQATIRLDEMPRVDISRAVLIRHGATHKQLISEDGSKLSPRNFAALIKKVDGAAQGNIGEALRWWCASIRPVGDHAITPDFSDKFSLPQHFEPDVALLLSRILHDKRSDEYNLRKSFGPAFNDRYADVIRRLTGMGMLVRLSNGRLEVEPSIVNALAEGIIDRN